MAFRPGHGFGFMPVYGAQMIPIVQTTQYLVPTGSVITSVNPRGGGGGRRGKYTTLKTEPTGSAPTTTVFVGNISEKASNELIKAMLSKCGTILNWKRVQGPSGRFQAFGFCEFDHPDSTLKAVRLLHQWRLADKALTVKVDEKTKETLREYVNKRRQAQGKPPIQCEGDQLPCDEDMQKEDELLRKALRNVMQDLGPDLIEGNEGVAKPRPRTPELYGKGGNLDIGSLDRERKEYIAREINSFRQTYMDDKKDKNKRDRRGRPDEKKQDGQPQPPNAQQPMAASVMAKNRPESRSSTATGGRVRSPSPSESNTGSVKAKRRVNTPDAVGGKGRIQKRSRSRSRSRLESDDDEETAHEKRRLERKMREKEASFLDRLAKWESREKKRAREYERDRLRQKLVRREEMREAKKLREFLEDYDDEKDDPKYYRGKNYDLRRRDYEKERENDKKDRQLEKEELEDIRKRLLEEGVADPEQELAKIQKEEDAKLTKRLNAGDSSESPSPVPHRMQRASASDEEEEGERRSESGDDRRRREKRRPEVLDADKEEAKKSRFISTTADTTASKPLGFSGLKLAPTATTSTAAPAAVQIEEEEEKKITTRRLVPLEYTEEEKMAVKKGASDGQTPHTPDDKKKIIKRIIEKIPTVKEELFAYPITWSQVDQALIDRRLKPWVTKKIVEYIGEEENSLVEFICQKIIQKTPPQTIVEDISMVLDEEASVFVVKLWRLLIYEIEAKKMGLVKEHHAS